MFWAQQETRDRHKQVVLTVEVIQDRHELALLWNQLWNDGTFWDAYDYELGIVRSKVSASWPNGEEMVLEPTYYYRQEMALQLQLNGSGLW
jgi:hypothetical protein